MRNTNFKQSFSKKQAELMINGESMYSEAASQSYTRNVEFMNNSGYKNIVSPSYYSRKNDQAMTHSGGLFTRNTLEKKRGGRPQHLDAVDVP